MAMGFSVIRSICRFGSEEGGAVAIQIALTTTVLLGFAGLVVDLGEAFTLNTELQHAADAAALAAAAELDGFTGAQTRATKAACGSGATCTFGPNIQRFASAGAGNIKLTSVVFLSAIDAAEPTLLPPVVAPAGDVAAAGDADSFYVRIQAQTSSVTGTLASLVTKNSIFTTTAAATAGRIPIACLDTPLAICNPLPGQNPFGAGGLQVGQEVQITNIGTGDWGGICPPNTGNCPKPTFESYVGNASSSSPAVASCVNSLTPYTSSPGNPNKPQFDTRFGVSSTASEPPSININEYPPDSVFTSTSLASGGTAVIGNGTWDATSATGYNWSAKHPGITYPPSTMGKNGPTGNPTRYDVYNWENTTGSAPNYSIPGGAQTSPGTPSADRRLMNMAVMDCSLSGRKQFGADAYLVGFLLRKWQTSLTDAFDTANQQMFFFEIQSALSFSNSGLIHNHVQLVR